MCQKKDTPLYDQTFLLDASSSYSRVKWPNGKEDTVSTSNLAPCPVPSKDKFILIAPQSEQRVDKPNAEITASPHRMCMQCVEPPRQCKSETSNDNFNSPASFFPRRTKRNRRPPDRYGDVVTNEQ